MALYTAAAKRLRACRMRGLKLNADGPRRYGGGQTQGASAVVVLIRVAELVVRGDWSILKALTTPLGSLVSF